MPVRKTILLVMSCYCAAITAYSQYKFDKALWITKENGLPTNETGQIRKDDDGFIWIATGDGLCRYDGQFVKVYQSGNDLKHSPLDNFINTILPVKNHIWIGTSQGISVLDTKTNSFRHYQFEDGKKSSTLKRRYDQNVAALFRDRSGAVWVGTRNMGVSRYNEAKDDFRFYTIDRNRYPRLNPSLGWDDATLYITQSNTNDSIIWVGTPGGLKKINQFTGEVKLYTFQKKNKDYQIALNAFRRVYHHDDGLLYLGGWAAGVNVFDPVTEQLTPLEIKNEVGKKILNSTIGNLNRKSDHEIWISTGLGLAVYDTKLHEVTWAKFHNGEKSEYYGIELIDDANRIWLPVVGGVVCYDPSLQQFARYSFRHLSNVEWAYAFYILTDKEGNRLTICPRQTDGIYHFNKLTKQWSKTLFPRHQNFNKESQAIRGFVQLPSADYVLSSDKGIFLFSEKTNTLKSFNSLPFPLTKIGSNILDHSGYLWMACDQNGLVKWKPGTKDFEIYRVHSSSDDSSDLPVWFNHFFEDSKRNIWSQTSNGIAVYVKATNTLLNFNYYKNEAKNLPMANSFAEDKNGRVWIASNDGWMGYALSSDPVKGVVYKFNIKERGFRGNIDQLATDKAGVVWGYTSKELVKINSSDGSFTTYNFRYGLDEADFYNFSFLPSGEIVFGGRNDIILANPSELKRNKEIPVPYIDRMEVLNQPFDFTHDGSTLNLGYRQNFFSIGFSALAFTMSKDVKFRYRLKGFDEWSEATRRRFANYTNVPEGNYVFQLQAANNEGIWNPKILELPLHVDTAFWLTWWFRAASLLLLGFAVYTLYRYRLRLVKNKQELKWEYERKLANVEMTALLAQMNPHFIFNSLNSIDSYIIRNESKQASEYLNNFARLMRLILQNSRSNYISLKDELVALELYLQMETLRFKNKFSYAIDVEEDLDAGSIVIPPMLIQPYIENAIWHGLMSKTNSETGKVELNIYKSNNNLHCIVRDNGIGRKKAAELKERKLTNHKRSMGMQITQDRIEIINKLYNLNTSVKISDLENEKGEASGTCVELIIPL